MKYKQLNELESGDILLKRILVNNGLCIKTRWESVEIKNIVKPTNGIPCHFIFEFWGFRVFDTVAQYIFLIDKEEEFNNVLYMVE